MTPSETPDPKESLRDSLRSKIRNNAQPAPEAPDSSPPGPPTPSPVDDGASRMETRTPEKSGGGLKKEIHFGNPGLAQMTAFCRQLATLVEVGIPLVQSLGTLSQRVEHPKLKTVVSDVARRVESGESFADSLAHHPRLFSNLIINVVRIGEAGGILDKSLNYLAEIMERRYEIRRQVQSALAYPVAALIVCGLALMVILGFAMPVFEEVYAQSMPEGELPGLTQFTLGISGFVESFWWLIILVVGGGWFFLWQAVRKNPAARRTWDALCLKIPVAGPLTVKVNVTRSCRTLANLLHAGIPLLEALNITRETSENILVEEMFVKVHDNLEKGGQIDKPFREAHIFPELVVDMIAIGDETNRLDLMFDKIAETYDSDVDHSIRTMKAVLEPALIVVMGGIVLLLALSVLLPYWKLAQGFDN